MCQNMFYKRMIVAILLLSMIVPSCGGQKSQNSYVPPKADDYPPELTQPLPAPREISLDQPFPAAVTLAREVIAGGEARLPALITALLASGIAIRGENGGLAVQPAPSLPWRGIIFESWEVPLLANMLSDENTPTINLADLAETLTEIIPELNDAPVADLILEDIRANARDDKTPNQLWALFLTELGRQSQAHEPYDLLSEELDPETVQLDGLQASLILRQLKTDLLSLEGTWPTSLNKENRLASFQQFATPADAKRSLPCTLGDLEQKIFDIMAWANDVGIGGLEIGGYGWKGLLHLIEAKDGHLTTGEKLDKSRIWINILGAYVKFIWTYRALNAEISMATPLVRTKSIYPSKAGETKAATATINFKIGDAQLLNCFRIILNGAGIDFNLPNDGPIEDARVTWHGIDGFDPAAKFKGGPEQLVWFVGNHVNQTSNKDGQVQIKVQGVPQKEELSKNPQQVKKSASLYLTVAVQGANMYKDVSDAVKAAADMGIGLVMQFPLDLLYRIDWSTTGHFTFEVIDWTDAEWTGTITLYDSYKAFGTGKELDNIPRIEIYDHIINKTTRGTITILGNNSTAEQDLKRFPSQSGETKFVILGIKRVSASYSEEYHSSYYFYQYQDSLCREGHVNTVAHGSLEQEQGFVLTSNDRGQYFSNFSLRIPTTGMIKGVLKSYTLGCRTGNEGEFEEPTSGYTDTAIEIHGQLDPSNPNIIQGSEERNECRGNYCITHKLTWFLQRNSQ